MKLGFYRHALRLDLTENSNLDGEFNDKRRENSLSYNYSPAIWAGDCYNAYFRPRRVKWNEYEHEKHDALRSAGQFFLQ